jgi:hypothetical protein
VERKFGAYLADFAARSEKKLFLFDTFSRFDARDLVGIDRGRKLEFNDTSIEFVRETVGNDQVTTY